MLVGLDERFTRLGTSAASWPLTLPENPGDREIVRFADVVGSCKTNNLVLGRNDKKIMGLAEDMSISINYYAGGVIYNAANSDWRLL